MSYCFEIKSRNGNRWKINTGINDTVFDSVVKFSRQLKHEDESKHRTFVSEVLGNRLYFPNGNLVPLKQPVKRLFDMSRTGSLRTYKPLLW